MNVAEIEAGPRLPRQVTERADRARARHQATSQSPSSSGAPPAPAGTEATESPNSAPQNREETPGYWKQRFSVTEGMLKKERAELPQRIAEAVAARDAEITRLNGLLEKAREGKPIDEPLPLEDFFSPEQISEFGEEQLRTIMTAAQKRTESTVKAAIAAAMEPIEAERKAVASRNANDRNQAFFDKLTELVPTWRDIDNGKPDGADPRWAAWLLQEDDATGEERQAILAKWYGQKNAERVARLFKAFLKTLPKQTVTADEPPIGPGGTGAHSQGSDDQGERPYVLNTATIRDYYKRSALGKLQPGEKERFDKAMAAARARGER